MPVALRKLGKATKIALSILGIPQNQPQKKRANRKKKDIEQRLVFEDTQRVR